MKEIHRNDVNLRDVLEFLELLQDRNSVVYGPAGFDNAGDIIVVRAPARLDLMGGIADYCGSNVFEATLSNSLVVGSQLRDDKLLKAFSIDAERDGLDSSFCLPAGEFYNGNSLKSYEEVGRLFRKNAASRWAGYCLGALYVLLREKKINAFRNGVTMVIKSNIPMGTGISSSAALEIAAMATATAQYGLKLDMLESARLAQVTENKVVGAPCGIMDQITSAAGEAGKVISILCQPDRVLELVDLPENVQVVGINSRVKRSTGGSAYIDTRTAAFMGLTIISRDFQPEASRLHGYLCNATARELREKYWNALPRRISGRDFLDRYGETIDPVTTVDPNKTYMVRSRSEHPVYENQRVKSFVKCLKTMSASDRCAAPVASPQGSIPEELVNAGRLMYASHWSYGQRAGLGSHNVDIVVNKVRKIGPAGGLMGAKITGGGAGGTAAVLCYGDVSDSLSAVLDHYKSETGIDPQIFTGSSPGAFKFGYLRCRIGGA